MRLPSGGFPCRLLIDRVRRYPAQFAAAGAILAVRHDRVARPELLLITPVTAVGFAHHVPRPFGADHSDRRAGTAGQRPKGPWHPSKLDWDMSLSTLLIAARVCLGGRLCFPLWAPRRYSHEPITRRLRRLDRRRGIARDVSWDRAAALTITATAAPIPAQRRSHP